MPVRLLCIILLAAPAMAQWVPNQLKQVVILTRHGVRSPLDPMKEYADKSWPEIQKDWHVKCCGDLTPRGEELVALMGAYYRAYYSGQGLFPAEGCLADEVYIWADNEERTLHTAEGLVRGLMGKMVGCSIKVNSLTYTPKPCPGGCQRTPGKDDRDLWFHALPVFWNKRITESDTLELQAVVNGLNDSVRYQKLLTAFAGPLQSLQKTLGCCGTTMCPGKPSCTLQTLPHQAQVGTGTGSAITWKSPFSVGSTASEVFLLEYANGMPCNLVGWGNAVFDGPDCARPGGEAFRQMQEIHTTFFQLVQGPRIVAQIEGSNLANQILRELESAVNAKGAQPRKMVIFSGHDTNIANVAALLGLSWTLPDLPKDDTPPAGALVFELYSDVNPDTYYVRIRYVHQTLWQLRAKTSLTLLEAPAWSDLRLPGCSGACSFGTFKGIVIGKIPPRFVSGHTL